MNSQWGNEKEGDFDVYPIINLNFDFTASELHKYFAENIYFCNDDFLSKKRSKFNFISFFWSYRQKKVAKNSVFCTSVSKYLQIKLKNYNPKSYLILTGASNVNDNIKGSLKRSNGNINIVYVGWLSKLNPIWVKEISLLNKSKILHKNVSVIVN